MTTPTRNTTLTGEVAGVLLAATNDAALRARVLDHLGAADILNLIRNGPPAGLGDALVATYLNRLDADASAETKPPATAEAAPIEPPPPAEADHYDVTAAALKIAEEVGPVPRRKGDLPTWTERYHRRVAVERARIKRRAGGLSAAGTTGTLYQRLKDLTGVLPDREAVRAIESKLAQPVT